jgi:S-adenosylmethionine-diacylglycerol 3-amino-3-carboxypropyl transferase
MTAKDVVRYANCWEDSEIILKALKVKEKGEYLSISSAGDIVLSVLTRNPNFVLAIDRSTAQTACLEIRKVVFQNLPYHETLSFMGIKEGTDRILTYKNLRRFLSDESRNFWDSNPDSISEGIIHAGKVESYFRLFRKYFMPLIMSKNKWGELTKQKNKKERIGFYDKTLNSWRWNLFLNFVLNPVILKNLDLGRNSIQFKTIGKRTIKEGKERIKYALTELPTHDNPYLGYIIKGNFHNSLPFFLKEENYGRIRKNLNKLKIFKGTLKEGLETNKKTTFDGVYLSDIFEYMSYNQYVKSIEQILKQLKARGRIIFWDNLIRREPPDFLERGISMQKDMANNLFLQNRAFFYSSLNILEAKRN